MPRFSLEDYEPVEVRLARFYAEHPDGRVTTELETSQRHPDSSLIIQWVVKASLWDGEILLSTGYAEEVQAERGVNATSALENCETSAIGRALANANYAPKGARPSREEMEKVARAEILPADLAEIIAGSTTRDELKAIWDQNQAAPFRSALSRAIRERMEALDA